MKSTSCLLALSAAVLLLAHTQLVAQDVGNEPAPVLRLENMTKIPGTNIGFPADDRFVFNRIRTNMNPKNLGHTYAFDDYETVRVHNDGNADLVIEELELSEPSAFAFQRRDFENLPIAVKPGEHYDLSMVFVKADAFWKGATGVYESDLIIDTNAGETVATLAGHYQIRPEGAWEPTVDDISRLFGFFCQVPLGKLPMQYPTATQPDIYHGEIVVSEYWEQADPDKPVSIFFIYALGGGGHPNLKLIDENDEIVAGVDIYCNGRREINGQMVWVCQTVFPWEEDDPTKIVGTTVESIDKPFRLSISGRTTSGTGDIDPATGKPVTLAFRFFPIKDATDRFIKPNGYMIAFDVVPVKGSHANGDFNDYMLYASNIRPKDNQPELDLTK